MARTTITLKGAGIQDAQSLDISISVVATVNVDAVTARRRVTAWLVSEVGNMMMGGSPELVIGTETLWRVPVILTSSSAGTLGEVGIVVVDAVTGELHVSDDLRDQILNNVRDSNGSTLSAIS
ncbi:MAG TPA: hypothetical protein VF177_19510 [Anaerolineae bacterium]